MMMSDVRRGRFIKESKKTQNMRSSVRNAVMVARAAEAGWGDVIETFYGRGPSNNVSVCDHPDGQAVDIMKKGGAGEQYVEEFNDMARFFQKYADEYRVKYMIWRQRIWKISQSASIRPQQWEGMSDRGSPTANHMDHIHVAVDGVACNTGSFTHSYQTPNKKSRPIPPQLLKKRQPKSIEVGFKWGDDQGNKKKENDKKSDAHEQITRRTTIKRCTDDDKDKDKKIEGYCNGKYIWARLRSWGFTKEGAAGVLGNFYQESRFNPGANQSGGPGRGIAQWSEGARWDALVRWANKKDLKPNDIETQMDWVWVELNQPSYSSLKGKLRNVTNIEDAVKEFHDTYEGSADSSMSVRNRYARQWFDRFDGKPDNYFFVIKKIKNPDGSETETEVAEEPPEPEFVVSTLPSGLFSLSLLTPTQWGDVALVPDPTEADPDAEGDLDGTFTE